jgi:hypothetical protein
MLASRLRRELRKINHLRRGTRQAIPVAMKNKREEIESMIEDAGISEHNTYEDILWFASTGRANIRAHVEGMKQRAASGLCTPWLEGHIKAARIAWKFAKEVSS